MGFYVQLPGGWLALSFPLLPAAVPGPAGPPREPGESFHSDQFRDPCRRQSLCFVATASFTARCPDGMVGDSVTRTAQRSSRISLEHAQSLALIAAMEEADAALDCLWCETRCAQPDCEILIGTVNDNDAANTIQWLPSGDLVPVEGDQIRIEGLYALVAFADTGLITMQSDFFASPGSEIYLRRRTFCVEACSRISSEDAARSAQARANSRVAFFCEYSQEPEPELEPIGGWLL